MEALTAGKKMVFNSCWQTSTLKPFLCVGSCDKKKMLVMARLLDGGWSLGIV